jgi:hypothetical protein
LSQFELLEELGILFRVVQETLTLLAEFRDMAVRFGSMVMAALVKAFILCDDAREQPGAAKFDLTGVGLAFIQSGQAVPSSGMFKYTLWAYVQLYDDKPQGRARLALMRADSERRYFFREMAINHHNRLRPTSVIVRLLDCEFPGRGVYFLEFWYDDEWLGDQRLDIV